MTLEEVRQLKVGDIVWMLCLDEEPGTAVKCEVTKPANDCDVVTIKCVGRPDCKGHYPWHGDISKTETEVYEKAISRAESSIESSEDSIKTEKDNITQKKADIETLKAKLEEAKGKLVWITNCGEVQQVSSEDTGYANFIKYATKQEAYEALAEYYKGKYEEALVKSGRYSWAVGNNSETGEPKIFAAMNNGGEPKGYLEDVARCSSRQEAEAELERRKKND